MTLEHSVGPARVTQIGPGRLPPVGPARQQRVGPVTVFRDGPPPSYEEAPHHIHRALCLADQVAEIKRRLGFKLLTEQGTYVAEEPASRLERALAARREAQRRTAGKPRSFRQAVGSHFLKG